MPSEQRVGAIGTGASVPPEMCVHWMTDGWSHRQRCHRYPKCMTVRDLLATLQRLPKDIEVLAFEAACEDYCEREVDEVEWQGGRVYLHLGARRDDPPRG